VKRSRLATGVAQALRGLGTPSAGQAVVVALSGGPDSVALLDVMASLARRAGFVVVAAHLDHALRPESAEDAAFCRDLSAELGVPFRTARVDVRARAAREGGGIEEAARLERHAFLRQVKEEEGACAIALAHTRDDQAETVLLRMLRGAGGLGLSAMRPRAGDLLRPMLALSRRDVLDHLAQRGLAWREDPTNADVTIARNRVRHELIPYLERHFNPALRDGLARMAAVLAGDADVLAALAGDAHDARGRTEGGAYVLSRAALNAAPRAVARLSVRRALQESGGRRGVGLGHVDAILDLAGSAAPSGRRLPLPGGREAVFHFDEVRIGARCAPAAPFALPLSVPGSVDLPDGRSVVARSARGPVASSATTAVVAVPDEPLVVRTRRPGDRVRAGGRDLSLKRFLMDRRVPAHERGALPLIAAGDRVLWVAGQHVDGGRTDGRGYVRLELQGASDRRQR
jgi:tRNA(Ile)-lysidine synthase